MHSSDSTPLFFSFLPFSRLCLCKKLCVRPLMPLFLSFYWFCTGFAVAVRNAPVVRKFFIGL